MDTSSKNLPSPRFYKEESSSLWEREVRRDFRYNVLSIIRLLIFAVIIIFLSIAAFTRNSVWHDPVTLYEDTITKSMSKARPHYNLGRLYRDKGRDNDALREYRTAARIDPADAVTHYNIGNIHLVQGRVDEALREYRTALSLTPDYADAQYNLDVAYRILGSAEGSSRAGGLGSGGDAAAHVDKGNLFFSRGLLDEAAREYKTAIGLKPDFAEARYNLGKAYRGQGRNDEALREFEAATLLNPNDADTHYTLGNICFTLGRFDEAVRAYRAALRLKPGFADAQYNLDVVQRALKGR